MKVQLISYPSPPQEVVVTMTYAEAKAIMECKIPPGELPQIYPLAAALYDAGVR